MASEKDDGVKFTKGPWTFSPSVENPRHELPNNGGALVASVDAGKLPPLVLVGADADNREEVIANARLISAAPDLYEALRMAERWLTEMHSETDDGEKTEMRDVHSAAWESIDKIRAALSLANGDA